ncbi:dihydrolipoamide acetyltransferase family protein [Staphylococcus felis]|uniref:dihydrolipoamide acetyltransferase family protein n=1 Tax=Staphylococcus felis TaxID=46127 RepID=UPI0021D1430E|nr:dihydrolipoamide acetyltransferase family protein [Staphylococcus felis]UXR85738.1 2-oxo acid dehydrogenase subunit E2 [Staphylococcus felis]
MEIKMPKLGESVHEGTIDQWLVKEGDYVEEYQPLCEVITDKVTAEVPSSYAGQIKKITAQSGETVQVGETICELVNDQTETINNEDETSDKIEKNKPTEVVSKTDSLDNKSYTSIATDTHKTKNNGRFSPVVFKLASEHQIDLSQVEGTGFEGRVTKKDILKIIHSSTTTSDQTLQHDKVSTNDVSQKSLPINGLRRQIAQKMKQSVHEIPHAWMAVEVDATEMSKTRNHFKHSFKQQENYNLTYFAFFVKAVAESLKNHPLLNSSWTNNEIVIHSDINISIAVAVEQKLFVPVIRNADEKSIKGIAKEIHNLAEKARRNVLTQNDMQGGTFTVNNTGSFGSVSSMGIINYPQAAILQVESIVKRPVVIDDMIAIRNMVNLCLSIDHRILDGLAAGQFLQEVKQRIENYKLEHTSIY